MNNDARQVDYHLNRFLINKNIQLIMNKGRLLYKGTKSFVSKFIPPFQFLKQRDTSVITSAITPP